MENVIIAINAVLPMFLLIGAGCVARQRGVISETAARQANSLCFKLFLSVMTFYNIYSADLSASFNGTLLLFCIGGVLVHFALGMLIVPRIEKSPPARGVMVQSVYRSNVLLLGMPIATTLFGTESLGQFTLLVVIMGPLFSGISVIALEVFRSKDVKPWKLFQGILTNPLVLGPLLGTLCVLAGIRLPAVLESAVSSLAKAATPMALVLAGASMNLTRLAGSMRDLIICVVTRLIISPAVMLTLGVALGYRGIDLGCIMLTFATPVSVSFYTMAMQMDGDPDLAGGVLLTTTALSCFTLCVWVWLFKCMGLF